MTPLQPKFTITNRMTAAITLIERARGFLEAARLSDDCERMRDVLKKANSYLLSMGRLALHQFRWKEYITLSF